MTARDRAPKQTCPCSRLRAGGRLTELTNPDEAARKSNDAFVVQAGGTRYPPRFYCLCRVCGTRWTVWEEVDIKESEILYRWKEESWNEEDIRAELEHEEGAVRSLRARQTRQLAAETATGKVAPSRPATSQNIDPMIEQTGPLEWRWADQRGVAYGCRIEGVRLAVWTEDPFGGTGTDYSVSEFLDGLHDTVLPPAVAGQVKQALKVRRKK